MPRVVMPSHTPHGPPRQLGGQQVDGAFARLPPLSGRYATKPLYFFRKAHAQFFA